MALNLYAGSTVSGMVKLPSPVSLKPSKEIIWSQDTGRAQTTNGNAKMIGDVVAEKMTYEIGWDMLTATEFNKIKNNLTAGFFYFAVGASAPQSADKYYRSEITYNMVQVGASDIRYRNVSVSVIQQ